MSYIKNTQSTIDLFKDKVISKIEIRRNDLPNWMSRLVSSLALKKWDEIDSAIYWHLYSVIFFTDGTSLQVEKYENIIVGTKLDPSKKNQVMTISNVPRGLTLGTLLSNTHRDLGENYFRYNALPGKDMNGTNCQGFLLAVLKSNDMLTPELSKFIDQDSEDLARDVPQFARNISQAVTDLQALIQRKRQDWGLRKGGIVRKRYRKF